MNYCMKVKLNENTQTNEINSMSLKSIVNITDKLEIVLKDAVQESKAYFNTHFEILFNTKEKTIYVNYKNIKEADLAIHHEKISSKSYKHLKICKEVAILKNDLQTDGATEAPKSLTLESGILLELSLVEKVSENYRNLATILTNSIGKEVDLDFDHFVFKVSNSEAKDPDEPLSIIEERSKMVQGLITANDKKNEVINFQLFESKKVLKIKYSSCNQEHLNEYIEHHLKNEDYIHINICPILKISNMNMPFEKVTKFSLIDFFEKNKKAA